MANKLCQSSFFSRVDVSWRRADRPSLPPLLRPGPDPIQRPAKLPLRWLEWPISSNSFHENYDKDDTSWWNKADQWLAKRSLQSQCSLQNLGFRKHCVFSSSTELQSYGNYSIRLGCKCRTSMQQALYYTVLPLILHSAAVNIHKAVSSSSSSSSRTAVRRHNERTKCIVNNGEYNKNNNNYYYTILILIVYNIHFVRWNKLIFSNWVNSVPHQKTSDTDRQDGGWHVTHLYKVVNEPTLVMAELIVGASFKASWTGSITWLYSPITRTCHSRSACQPGSGSIGTFDRISPRVPADRQTPHTHTHTQQAPTLHVAQSTVEWRQQLVYGYFRQHNYTIAYTNRHKCTHAQQTKEASVSGPSSFSWRDEADTLVMPAAAFDMSHIN